MASESPVFCRTCEELERLTSFDRLEARGTVRLGLKGAGLDPATVDVPQMTAMLRKLLPAELASRGVDDGDRIGEEIARAIADIVFDGPVDRASSAAATIGRFGG